MKKAGIIVIFPEGKVAIFRRKMSGFEVLQDFESTKCGEIRVSQATKYLLSPTSFDDFSGSIAGDIDEKAELMAADHFCL